jgi:hypothetical protein
MESDEEESRFDPSIAERFEYLSPRFFKFNCITKENGDGSKNINFTCHLCIKKTYVSCSTKAISNLRRHVDRNHNCFLKEFDAVMEKNKKRPSTFNQPPSKRTRTREDGNISEFFSTSASPSPTYVSQEALNTRITNLIIHEGLAFRIVESKFFKDVALAGLPDRKVLGYRSLKARIDD